VQFAGRRFSLKLEHGFWAFLEESARNREIRLNELIGELARGLAPGVGFTAYLRLFCLAEALARLRAAERRIADLSLAAGDTDLASIIGACPAPCLLISQDRVIRRVNQAFVHWLGARYEELLGQPFDRFFQIRGHFHFDELWTRFGNGYTKAVPAKQSKTSIL